MPLVSLNVPSSPSKLRRDNVDQTLTRTRQDARNELRAMAHGKTYICKLEHLIRGFLPEKKSSSKKAVSNIFAGVPTTFSSEKAMYESIVSRCHSRILSSIC